MVGHSRLAIGHCTEERTTYLCFVGDEFLRSVPPVSRKLLWAIDSGALFAWQLRHRAEERICIFFAF